MTEDDPLGPLQSLLPSPAFGIVKHDDKVARSSLLEPSGDDLPGDEEVAQADAGKIVEGGAEEGGGGAERRDSGDDFELEVQIFLLGQNFEDSR